MSMANEALALEEAAAAAARVRPRRRGLISLARSPISGKAVQVLADVAAFALAGAASLLAAPSGSGLAGTAANPTMLALGIALGLALLVHRRTYTARIIAQRLDEWTGIAGAMFLLGLLLISIGHVFDMAFSQRWLFAFVASAFVLTLSERELTRAWFRRQRALGLRLRPTMIIGSPAHAVDLTDTLGSAVGLGYSVLGTCTLDEALGAGSATSAADAVSTLVRTCVGAGATTAILVGAAVEGAMTSQLVRELHDAGMHVEVASGLVGIAPERLTIRSLGAQPVLYLEPAVHNGWRAVAKRTFDIVGAVGLLAAASPVVIASAIAVKLGSPGSILFRQVRVGRNGAHFNVLKLRTMVSGAEAMLVELRDQNEADGPLFKMKDDPRVTKVGRVLRKLSADELPQLWNVLRGDMSLVGPRPALVTEVEQWDDLVRNRLRVKPGITGMWQVSGRSDASFESYVRLDLFYVDNWTFWSDISILAKTVPIVLARRGAY